MAVTWRVRARLPRNPVSIRFDPAVSTSQLAVNRAAGVAHGGQDPAALRRDQLSHRSGRRRGRTDAGVKRSGSATACYQKRSRRAGRLSGGRCPTAAHRPVAAKRRSGDRSLRGLACRGAAWNAAVSEAALAFSTPDPSSRSRSAATSRRTRAASIASTFPRYNATVQLHDGEIVEFPGGAPMHGCGSWPRLRFQGLPPAIEIGQLICRSPCSARAAGRQPRRWGGVAAVISAESFPPASSSRDQRRRA